MLQWYYNNGVVNSFTVLDRKLDKDYDGLNSSFLNNSKENNSIKLDAQKSYEYLDEVKTLEELF